MAERRKNRKKKEQTEVTEDDGKPSKQEYAVAKYLRQQLPEKKTTFLGHKVEYFIASKAIDCLLDSPFAGKRCDLFTTRESVAEYMDKMLQHKFFHRARKIIVQKDAKKKKKEGEETAAESGKEKESKKSKGKEEVKEKAEEKKDSEEGVEKKKEKKKIKLDMHLEQLFLDGNEVYVWIYDPIPMRTWIIGMLMVIGAVLVCLFPLWPQTIRHYIYYLSVAAAFFLVFIIGLAVVRLVIFVLVWLVTLGKHHFWLLPNLTEDVGFFESFWPLYKYEYKGPKSKDKESDKEKHEDVEEVKKSSEKTDSSSEQEGKGDQKHNESECESENEKQKADNGDNGFEILDVAETGQSEKKDKTDEEIE